MTTSSWRLLAVGGFGWSGWVVGWLVGRLVGWSAGPSQQTTSSHLPTSSPAHAATPIPKAPPAAPRPTIGVGLTSDTSPVTR